MEKIVITMHQDRVTKNTIRFEEEVVNGEEAVLKTMYVQKSAFDGDVPERVQITIENAPEEG